MVVLPKLTVLRRSTFLLWATVVVCDVQAAATRRSHRHLNLQSRDIMWHHPPLELLERALLTTANEEFGGSQEAFEWAANWTGEQLNSRDGDEHRPAPYLACSAYGNQDADKSGGIRNALSRTERHLSRGFSRVLSNGREHGMSCFVATATAEQARVLEAQGLTELGLRSFGPYPSVLKLAPGLLQMTEESDREAVHGEVESGEVDVRQAAVSTTERLRTKHGDIASMGNVGGLMVELSPGVLSAATMDASGSGSFTAGLLDGLMSSTIDLHEISYWSHPGLAHGGGVPSTTRAERAREWTRAADVVHGLSGLAEEGRRITPGDVCSWDSLNTHYPGGDSLMLTGLDHLLPSGRGAGGRDGEESTELKIACFMGLLSYLASVPEVFRVSPMHKAELMNAVAKAITQSASLTGIPLTDSGLDGTGEVIQIVDSGADQSSCYFIDEDEQEVEGGYYFEEFALLGEVSTASLAVGVFIGGYYPYDLSRRKIVQYISLVRPDDAGDTQQYGDYYTTQNGNKIPWYSADGFAEEKPGGHGSHTAGTAAGSILNAAAATTVCDTSRGELVGCVGGCLNTTYANSLTANSFVDVDTVCEAFDCDGFGDGFESCLEDDTKTILASHGGVAQGAKLAMFDTSSNGITVWASLAGNGLWNAAEDTGALIHSNSWGGDTFCNVDSSAVTFDHYMYENPEHLLIFAAGNDGMESRSSCTISNPAIAKNVLAVGASSAGSDRWTLTGEDGDMRSTADYDPASIDTVAVFSSRGPTNDNRIKPELVAPGDQVLSVSSAGETGPSCVLELQAGTSMATPVVAGAAAMIRQYFRDERFYVADAFARGVCPNAQAKCETFDPSAATVKAMLINSANLMGGSSEPDGERGFGRVHLEAGLPLNRTGDIGLFVSDSSWTNITESSVETFDFELADEDDGEFRATLTWIDPAASSASARQLIHDLDLTVTSPSGTVYTMWKSGAVDNDNVVERVIVPSEDVRDADAGMWVVTVTSEENFTKEMQAYSLVVTGPFGSGIKVIAVEVSSARPRVAVGGLGATYGLTHSVRLGLLSLVVGMLFI